METDQLEQVQSKLVIVKAKQMGEGEIEAVLSTDDLDRHGEHVSIKGLVVPKDQVIKMYYNHQTYGDALPIGKWVRIWKANGKLMGHGVFDLEDAFAYKVYRKVQNGFIDSISIGFYPQEYDGDSSTWTKSTLVEASIVAEPANTHAVITSKSASKLGFTEEEFKETLKVKLKEKGIEPDVADPPEHADPVFDDDDDESNKDGVATTEIKAALTELKSKVEALEVAHEAANPNPATKTLIKVRLAAKEVDKAVGDLNKVIRIKLKESN